MALIPLIPIPILDGKLVAHIYGDTPLWLVQLSSQAFDPTATALRALQVSAALAVQQWSGELAEEMGEWVRPHRTSDILSIDLDKKCEVLGELDIPTLGKISNDFLARSGLSVEEKKRSNEASESPEPASGASSVELTADPAPIEPS